MIFVLVLFAVVLVLAVVFVAIHVIKPERLSLGVHSKWGTIGLDVERPGYLEAGSHGAAEAGDDRTLPTP